MDEKTLVIPDRPGNRRADMLSNILENPRVGLLFIIPGLDETLRVNGRAISTLRDRAAGHDPLHLLICYTSNNVKVCVIVQQNDLVTLRNRGKE